MQGEKSRHIINSLNHLQKSEATCGSSMYMDSYWNTTYGKTAANRETYFCVRSAALKAGGYSKAEWKTMPQMAVAENMERRQK